MKIRIVSDLHIEFYSKNEYLLPIGEDEAESVLVLAGDIIAGKPNNYRYFFEDIHSRFKKVIFICGNHEYYRGSIIRIPEKITEMLSGLTDKILFGDNKTSIIDDVAFIYSTLWTDFDDGNVFSLIDANRGMNDFHIIRTGTKQDPYKRKFKAEDAYSIHKLSVGYIFGEVLHHKNDGKKVVVVTHHGPSFQLVAPQYKNSGLNGCYFSDLDEEILRCKPDIMFFGHTHCSSDMHIGDTRIISNSFGYYQTEENPEFDPFLTLEI